MQSSPNPYEAQKVVDEYLAFHYCLAEEYVEYPFVPKEILDFPKRCAELCIKHKTVRLWLWLIHWPWTSVCAGILLQAFHWFYTQDGILNRVLDVGCSVGRSSFELAREYNEVVGLDYSQVRVKLCRMVTMSFRMWQHSMMPSSKQLHEFFFLHWAHQERYNDHKFYSTIFANFHKL